MADTGVILGFDIGGANIKVATSDGNYAHSLPFPMWSLHNQLATAISSLIAEYQKAHGVPRAMAVTMTGELADGFKSKCDGVTSICNAVIEGAADTDTVLFYETGGKWCRADEAANRWDKLAASNWYAMADHCRRLLPNGIHILIDIGTTTTDIIPLADGEILANGVDDTTRLQRGELVYCGIERASLSSIVSSLLIDGTTTPIARERFATTLDTFLITGELPEQPEYIETADSKPATRRAAHRRMARLICQCPESLSAKQAEQIAQQTRDAIVQLLSSAYQQVTSQIGSPINSIIAVGQGDFLIADFTDDLPVQHLRDLHPDSSQNLARIGPAFAVAVLLEQHLNQA